MIPLNLVVKLDFITVDQEENIIGNLILDHINIPFGKGDGYRSGIFRYGKKELHPDRWVSETFPSYLTLDIGFPYNSITINHYQKGDVIDWHIDKSNTGKVISILSLMSDSVLEFREKLNKTKIVTQNMERRSLVQMSDMIRYKWEHRLEATSERWSIVYRNIS